jgi:protein O-GlcNAc transferase
MKKIIAFSLYGDNPKYCVGTIKNVLLQPEIYPDWICRIYYNYTVPSYYINELKKLNAELVDMSNTNLNGFGMFWRFMVYDDKEVERFIVRDTDSRLNNREKEAVNQWIESDKNLHIMRDHPQHGVLILGGTWGMKNDHKFNMSEMINTYLKDKSLFNYGDDQRFLIKIHKAYMDSMICHDDFFDFPNNYPFPSDRNNFEFIGQVFNENDETVIEHIENLKQYLKILK